MKRLAVLLIALTFMCLSAGCAPHEKVTVCPSFPNPADNAVNKIQALHDQEVDAWMVGLYKLKKELEVTDQQSNK